MNRWICTLLLIYCKKNVYDIMLHFPLKNPIENDLKPLSMHRWRKENQTKFTSLFIDYKYWPEKRVLKKKNPNRIIIGQWLCCSLNSCTRFTNIIRYCCSLGRVIIYLWGKMNYTNLWLKRKWHCKCWMNKW